ncbi:MAG: MAF protein [Alphaproteobacteria bacterium]|jgi:MAF protein
MTFPQQSCHPILLASSSTYRASLLAQLSVDFIQASPNIDESHISSETPHAMVSRLSEQKAMALRKQYPSHVIIASDQIALTHNNEILGKPHNHETAVKQLMQASGQRVAFLTGLCVLSPQANNDGTWHKQLVVEPYIVYFRKLTVSQVIDYVTREKPFDCAGSFKSEGLGISLFEKLEGDDPNALIGLPLIQLCSMLENIGMPILAKN